MFVCVCLCSENTSSVSKIYSECKCLSNVGFFATHGLHVACLAPLSMEFSRQQDWSGLPFPSLGDLPDSGIKRSSQVLAKGHLFCCLQSLPESLEKEI